MKTLIFSLSLFILLCIIILPGCNDNDNNINPPYGGNMRVISRYTTPSYCLDSYVKNISGTDYSFLALGSSGIEILNVSNPSSPQYVSSYNLSGFTEEVYPAVFNGVPYLFVAAGNEGTAVLNITNFNSIVVDTIIPFPGDYISSVFIDTTNKTLFCGGSGANMYILDLTNLPAVSYYSTYQTYSIINEIQVQNNFAYIAQDTGLDIVNVSNPQSPVRVASGSDGYIFYDIKLRGDLAIIANDENGVLIMNISNPSNPFEVGFLDTYDIGLACAVNGNIVYVAEDYSGVEAFDISNPSSPQYLANYTTNSYSENVTYYNGYTYVSDYNAYVVLKYP